MQARNVVVVGILVGLAVITGLWIGTQWGDREPLIQTEYVGLQSEQVLLSRLDAMEEILANLAGQMEQLTHEQDHLDQIYLGLEGVLLDLEALELAALAGPDEESMLLLREQQQEELLAVVQQSIADAMALQTEGTAVESFDVEEMFSTWRTMLQEELASLALEPPVVDPAPIVLAIEDVVREQMTILAEQPTESLDQEQLLVDITAVIEDRLAEGAPAIDEEALLVALRSEWNQAITDLDWNAPITDAVAHALAASPEPSVLDRDELESIVSAAVRDALDAYELPVPVVQPSWDQEAVESAVRAAVREEWQATGSDGAATPFEGLDMEALRAVVRTAVRDEWYALGLEERMIAQVEESIQQEVALWPAAPPVEEPIVIEPGEEPPADTQEVIVLADTDIIRITDEHYVIRVLPGDNIWNLMRRIYGRVTFEGIDEILELNGLADARHLRAGANLLMPRVIQ